MYFVADFVGSGRQNYCVQFGKEMFFYKTMVQSRREELIIPKLDAKKLNLKERNPNVFKNWAKDTPEILENCMR